MGRILHPLTVTLMVVSAMVSAAVASGPAWSESRSKAEGQFGEIERPLVLIPVVWRVLDDRVVPVKGTDRRIHLAYELLLTNVTSNTVRIEGIEAVDPSRDDEVVGVDRVVTIRDEDVTGQVRLFSRQSTMEKADYSLLVPPGESGIVYVDLTLEDRQETPRVIGHRVTVSEPDAEGAPEVTSVGGFVKVNKPRAVVVKPPLRGDRWVNGDGCCAIIGPHRFTVLPINGKERVPEHFAIDFIRLDEEGRLFTGDPKVLENWWYYGSDVVAAASGKVVEVVDDLPDQVPGELPPGITAAEAAGNHVIIDIGEGRFTLYAHMIPGSIVVEPGQRVRAGQLLGHLGNSGNTDAPHLHFHVMDSPSALNTTGLPFVFDRMQLEGRLVGSLAEVQDLLLSGNVAVIDDTDTGVRRRQMPLTSDVVGFR